MAVGCVNQSNAAPDEKHDALPLSIQLSVLEDCYVTMLDIAMLDVTSTPLTTEGAPKLCRLTSENDVTPWEFCTILSGNCVLSL